MQTAAPAVTAAASSIFNGTMPALAGATPISPDATTRLGDGEHAAQRVTLTSRQYVPRCRRNGT